MIGIINLEEIVQECLKCENTQIIRLFPLVCDNLENPFVYGTIVPTMKTINGSSIDINPSSEPFLTVIKNPEINIRNTRLLHSMINIQKSHDSSKYHYLSSSIQLHNINDEFVKSLGSLKELEIVIKEDLTQQITSFARPSDVEIILGNLNINITYNSDQQKLTLDVNSITEPAIITGRYERIESPYTLEFELLDSETQEQKEKRLSHEFLHAHILSHTTILDILIKKVLKDTYDKERFYFCLGRDHEEGITQRCRTHITNKHKNIFLILLQNIKEEKPNISGYKIEEILGEGSYKQVYKGNSTSLNNTVAVKTINIPLLALQPNIQRAIKAKIDSHFNGNIEDAIIKIFQEEAQLMLKATQARSKNLPIIFGATYDEKTQQYIIIEELGDETLADVLKREQKLSPEKTYEYIKQVINGLKQLHSLGFIHGDLKPENILVNKDGTVRITDFGWSSQIPLLSEHYDDPRYLTNLLTSAPELFDGEHATNLSDLWSVGVIAYRMMIGEWPFHHGFTGSEEEWKVLSLKEKQQHARKIREQIDNIKIMSEIKNKISQVRRPYIINVPVEIDQYSIPNPSEIIDAPLNFFDTLFGWTILTSFVYHDNLDLDSKPKLLLDKKFIRSMGFTYLNPHTELI